MGFQPHPKCSPSDLLRKLQSQELSMFHACLSFRYPVASRWSESPCLTVLGKFCWWFILFPPPDSHHFEAPKSGLNLTPSSQGKGQALQKKWYQQLELPTLQKNGSFITYIYIHIIYIFISIDILTQNPWTTSKKNITFVFNVFLCFHNFSYRQAKAPPRQTRAWARCENSVGLLGEM